MWRRSLIITGFCGILCVANGCAVTSGCGGCGEDGCGEAFGAADFACGGVNPHDLPPITGHLPGCGCQDEVVPGCAAPSMAGCGLDGLITADVTCAAPGGCTSCPTCAAPFASTAAMPYQAHAAPHLAPTAAPQPIPAPAPPAMAPQSVYPPPLQGAPVEAYSSGIPLGVPAPTTTTAPAASAPAASAPATSNPSAPAGTDADAVPTPGGAGGFDPEDAFEQGARYYQPRAIRPVNAVPMGNGYYIQQQGGQVPVRRAQGQRQGLRVPVRRVQQTSATRDQGLKTFYLD